MDDVTKGNDTDYDLTEEEIQRLIEEGALDVARR